MSGLQPNTPQPSPRDSLITGGLLPVGIETQT